RERANCLSMSSCGTVPYRPRRSFSSPIISSLHVQPRSFTSRKAKSPGSGVRSMPGAPQAPSSIRSASGKRFMSISLNSESEGQEERDLVLELGAADGFVDRNLDGNLEVEGGLRPEGPVQAHREEIAAGIRHAEAALRVGPFMAVAQHD